jgi:molecular chaperone GrpE
MAEAAAAVSSDAEDDDIHVEVVDDSPAPEPADDPPGGDAAARLAELEAEVASLKDKWLRSVADLDNHKKRTRREIDEAVLRRTQDLLKGFLPTVDNLGRALQVAAPGSTVSAEEQLTQLIKGIEMVRDEFLKALAGHGIEPVPAVGAMFDPNIHDALQQVDSEEHAPGVVVMEFEKGYTQGERLLRPARVVVAGPGSTGAPASGDDGE